MTQAADHQDAPLGTILPFLDESDVPPTFMVLKGQTVTKYAHPLTVAKFNRQWSGVHGPVAEMVRQWWTQHGGVVEPDYVILPVIEHDEVFTMAFNTQTKPKDAKPVLAVKIVRAPNQ